MLTPNWNPSNKDLRWFVVFLVAFAAIAAWWLNNRWGASTFAIAVVIIAVCIVAVGLIAPRRVRWIYIGWMAAAFPIGWIVSHVLLAVVFYGMFTPSRLVMRLFGRDGLGKKFDSDAETYWIKREEPSDNDRYFKQY